MNSAIMIKKCKETLIDPLLILWKKSMETGNFPDVFRTAYLTPIVKPGGSKSIPAHYRPVSLPSHIVKIFERILKKYLQGQKEGCA